MDRRRFVKATGAGVAGLLAGCSAEPTDDGSTETSEPTDSGGDDIGTSSGGDSQTATPTDTASSGTPVLRVGTYSSFVDAPSSAPGPWLKEQFESEYDAELQWFAPEGNMDYFLQRRQQNVTIDTDLFLGLTPEEQVGVDGDVLLAALEEVVHVPLRREIGRASCRERV